MSNTLFMFDDTDISLDPPNAYAYAGYVDGDFANFALLKKTFPKAHLLSITVFGNKADCYDIEPGDGTNAQVYAWFLQMEADGVWRPCIYTSASNMAAMQATMKANGFARSSYRMWSAHYTGVPHFCGPNTCGFGLDQADATQFTDRALGKSLDESIIADDFFEPSNEVNPVKDLEIVKRGFTGLTVGWTENVAERDATVKCYRKRSMRLKSSVVTVENPYRVRRLWPHTTYHIEVRGHPGASTGSTASVNGTTR